MLHITLESLDHLLEEKNQAALDAKKCREFVNEYGHLLTCLSKENVEEYLSPEIASTLAYWQDQFDENEDFSPSSVLASEATLQRPATLKISA